MVSPDSVNGKTKAGAATASGANSGSAGSAGAKEPSDEAGTVPIAAVVPPRARPAAPRLANWAEGIIRPFGGVGPAGSGAAIVGAVAGASGLPLASMLSKPGSPVAALIVCGVAEPAGAAFWLGPGAGPSGGALTGAGAVGGLAPEVGVGLATTIGGKF